MTTPALNAALVKALGSLTIVEAARTAKIPIKGGGDYSYSYADIGDVVKMTRPVLAAEGIVALTPVVAHETGLACLVVLVHESGEQMTMGPFPFPHGRDAQATGSMVTYHRRYALVAALGMAAGDDDDGAAAKPRQAAPPVTAPTPGEAARQDAALRIKALTEPHREKIREFCHDSVIPNVPKDWTDRQLNEVIVQIAHYEAEERSGTVGPDGTPEGATGDPGGRTCPCGAPATTGAEEDPLCDDHAPIDGDPAFGQADGQTS